MHQRGTDGSLTPIEFGLPEEPEFLMGGGGLYGTAGDYLAFCQMILHEGRFNGERLLRPETVAQMSQNHIGALEVACSGRRCRRSPTTSSCSPGCRRSGA